WRRIVPAKMRIATEVEHVVVMRVAAHPHRHRLDERRPFARTRALRGPAERAGDGFWVGAVERHAWNAVAGRLVGEHAHRRLIADRRRERGLIVLDAEDHRQLARRTEVDRLVPLAD